MDHEDPEAFLNHCEVNFTEASIEPSLWSRMVTKSLTEKASKWYEVYKTLSLPWAKFRTLLTQHFAGVSALNKLHIKLYSTKQEEREATGIFLQKKYLLALRLLPLAPEDQIISLLLEALIPSIKKVLRAANITTFEELVERAVQAEADETEGNPQKAAREQPAKNTTMSGTSLTGAEAKSAPTRPPPQCHYCPGRHLHRDCPVIKSRQAAAVPGNWRDRAAEADDPAAPTAPSTSQS
ncbi:activity-regulated cytoskeleton-associated protein-like [Belonocnema kinseyi]|uniref:activity-regulated cytoskeleton-associated protein-like n=1 Tax=Belonocnema kinseyi TaxID=2817044 RepID=UPI00143D7F05|nr:activity-regulated cytoskeleton-associated protein-like [Belonocnema kinseyi]